MNIFDLGLYELKDIGNSRVVCFLEHILDAVMKHAPVGFLMHFRNPEHDR